VDTDDRILLRDTDWLTRRHYNSLIALTSENTVVTVSWAGFGKPLGGSYHASQASVLSTSA